MPEALNGVSMQYICTSSESIRIGITNMYQLTSYTVEADNKEEALNKATQLVKVGYRIMNVMEDKYGPDWKPEF